MVNHNQQFMMIRQALERSYAMLQQGEEISPVTLSQLEEAKAEYEAALNFVSSTDSRFNSLS
ncbi:hypothetical protein FZC66_12645 [Priestia megaterium]|nr:hypothetical protein FZC66_12645 [Priestia megaterium]